MAMLALVAVLGLASCTKEKTVTVTFNANGGTGTMSVQTFTANESQALTANAFQKKVMNLLIGILYFDYLLLVVLLYHIQSMLYHL